MDWILQQGGEEMRKVLIPGFITGVGMLIVGMIVSWLINLALPNLMMEYRTTLFRPWEDPLMSLYFAHPFVLGLALAFVWDKVKGLLQGGPMKRATHFALAYFIVATIPGMLISYSSFPLSILMILSWTISSLVQAWAAGLVLAKLNS
jgi:hypothetical protein